MPITNGVFIAGTDTDCGKTLVSTAILQYWQSKGQRTLACKPVATGGLPYAKLATQLKNKTPTAPDKLSQLANPRENSASRPPELISPDAIALYHAQTELTLLNDVNPLCFGPPVSPHIAAQELGVRIEIDELYAHIIRINKDPTAKLVIEGTGGWLCPLSEDPLVTMADLAKKLGTPVILVVGFRLGCLNHALLTAASIRESGLNLSGWIGNCCDPDFDPTTNLQFLTNNLPAPCLGVIPYLTNHLRAKNYINI